MKKMIHRLRAQPEEVKIYILHALMILCGIILVLLWVYSLGAAFSNKEQQAKMSQDLKPFSNLKTNIIDGYQNITSTDANPQ